MQPRLKASIDLTPTVGVMLALVVCMMVVAPPREASVRLDLTPLHPTPGAAPPPPPPWFVLLRSDGSYWIVRDTEEPRPATPTQVLQEVPPDATIYLMAEADAAYGPFAELASLLDADGRAIVIVNEDLT